MAWLALGAAESLAPDPLTSLDREPRRRAEIAFETRRLRNLVDAYRFASGDWPRGLGELSARGWLPPGALAAIEEQPYYYVRRGDAVLVLAPQQ